MEVIFILLTVLTGLVGFLPIWYLVLGIRDEDYRKCLPSLISYVAFLILMGVSAYLASGIDMTTVFGAV